MNSTFELMSNEDFVLTICDRVAKHSCMPSALVKEVEVDGVPCLAVVASRPLVENEEVTLDLGYQLEV